MNTQINLTGFTQWNEKYPPNNAKKGYVAKITGRASGPVKYEREFLGQEIELLEGDEGLYERQQGDRKGGHTRWYHVVLSHPEHGLILSVDCEDQVPKIAKLLDSGISIEDAVEIQDIRPSQKVGGRMVFDAIARTATQAKKAKKSQTINSAVDACWEIVQSLPPAEAKKALTEIRKRLAG